MTGTYRSRIVLLAVSQTNQANVLVPKKKKKMKPVLVEKANMITTLFFFFFPFFQFKQPMYWSMFYQVKENSNSLFTTTLLNPFMVIDLHRIFKVLNFGHGAKLCYESCFLRSNNIMVSSTLDLC